VEAKAEAPLKNGKIYRNTYHFRFIFRLENLAGEGVQRHAPCPGSVVDDVRPHSSCGG
jgi:hypothetical protein